MIKNIIFDCSDTLLHFIAKDVLAKKIGDKDRACKIHYSVYGTDAWHQYVMGNISFEEVKERTYPNMCKEDREIADEYLKTRMCNYTVMEGIPELVSKLKQNGYKLFVLTDYPDYFDAVWNRFDIFRLFDGRCVSSEEHASKANDGKLFEIAVEKFGVSKEECVFIDNIEKTVENGRAHGLESILFTNTDDVIEQLRKLKVNI